ncbi:DUF4179 domain-containing protein [Brevibacillus ruminantium]|uniref:DUF4179 domain-containing protein n=1 Tax=Brevibacillus ruminantium TaxID=2950604 RepID=A0ABY4WL13_9BACL|nr:DUF4179 domain-containing protein [Brevibacillus ruminantium]USG67830.1 DUF4179 domain-containing protein [Brevibacillus ruminantium]
MIKSVICAIGLYIAGDLISNMNADSLLAERLSSKYQAPYQNLTTEDKGIKFSIKDIIYDHQQLLIKYTAEGEKAGGIHFNSVNLSVEGKELELGKSASYSQGRGEIRILTNNSLPKTFMLRLEISQLGDTVGKWILNVPVSTSEFEQSIVHYEPMITKKFRDASFEIKTVQISPHTTTISYTVVFPKYDDKRTLHIFVYDKNGIPFEPIGGEIKTLKNDGQWVTQKDNRVFITPKNKPDSLTLKVFDSQLKGTSKEPLATIELSK